MMASPRTKESAGVLASMGIKPMRKATKPPTQEQEAATRAEAEHRKRVRAAEHADLAADSELAASEPIAADPGEARRMIQDAADARAQRNLNTNNAIAKKKAEDAEAAALQATEPPTKKSKPAGTGDGHRIKRKAKVIKEKKNKEKTHSQATETVAEKQPVLPSDHESDSLSENQTNPPDTEGPKVHASHVPMCTYLMHTKHELWKIHSSENQKALRPNVTKSKDKVSGHTRHWKKKRKKKGQCTHTCPHPRLRLQGRSQSSRRTKRIVDISSRMKHSLDPCWPSVMRPRSKEPC